MTADDTMEVHFSLRLVDRAADHACCHNYPSENQAWDLLVPAVSGQVIEDASGE